MEISPMGWLLIPCGVFLFIFSRELLFYTFIFFVPFSASTVLNVDSLVRFGLQPGYFFALLWFLKISISSLYSNKLHFPSLSFVYLYPIIIFWFIALVSLSMPIILEGNVLVHYPWTEGWYFTRLELQGGHFTQFLYLTFVVLVVISICIEVRTREKLYKAIRILLISGTVVSLLGLWQSLGDHFGVPFPAGIFSNNIKFYLGYEQVAFEAVSGFNRMSSVAPEPSILASYFLWIFPLFFMLMVRKDTAVKVKKLYMYLTLFLFFISLVLTLSTTALAGIIFNFFLLLGYVDNGGFLKLGVIKKRFRLLFYLVMFVCLVAFTAWAVGSSLGINFSMLKDLFINLTINKTKNLSGIERSEGVAQGINIFLQYPLLGVGWGSNRTFDFSTTILSNTGALGFAAFVFFIVNLLIKLSRIARYSGYVSYRNLATAFSVSIISGMFSLFTASPDIIFLVIWTILGLTIAFINISVSSDPLCQDRCRRRERLLEKII
jgi:hypothetical protein